MLELEDSLLGMFEMAPRPSRYILIGCDLSILLRGPSFSLLRSTTIMRTLELRGTCISLQILLGTVLSLCSSWSYACSKQLSLRCL
jgi:hypothetical protein